MPTDAKGYVVVEFHHDLGREVVQVAEDFRRVRDESLDFREVPAGESVNAIHSYPAMFHPRVVRRFVREYSAEGDLVLDPFVGSGVAAVESAVTGRRFVGFDLNPLAILIAEVRTTPLSRDVLSRELERIVRTYPDLPPAPCTFRNVDFWFSGEARTAVAKLLTGVESIAHERIKKFFRVALSETIRAVSLSDPNEFKLVRRRKECPVPPLEVFRAVAEKNIRALADFYSEHEVRFKPDLRVKNVLLEDLDLEDGSISLLITSPPYGDSQTTVAYGQFSRLSLQWFGLPCSVDKESLGARPAPIKEGIPSETLYDFLGRVEERDPRRARQVYSFYSDLFRCMGKLVPKVRRGGHLVFVVGNRTVRGVELPTDVICAEMLCALGCRHVETRVRQIGNKRMPLQNSPTNVPGKKAPTMRYEYIVVCRREG